MPDDTVPPVPRPISDRIASTTVPVLAVAATPTPDTVPPPRFSPPVPRSVEGTDLPIGPTGYDLLGEIGRGGMGAVYRARDVGLDRDVAVKLLLDRYPAEGPVARRFLEEARITGQLQHPGIPAVHQVGTLADGRPFLAMKLIKGQTLSDLLKERTNCLVDRPRFVSVFEQLCLAVGYAHSRGVIHRDLKPANVMVGAFGEVQVMDWGLAKVLTSGGDDSRRLDVESTFETEIRSPRGEDESTRAGSVLGTPAYMPPEQAIGAVDQISARSDVFGLGAILCTILTGHPPYVGGDAESTRQLAARGKLDEAFARLDTSGSEPDLVALAKRCLAAEPADRPADAATVAADVAKLRAAADERARTAELTSARELARRRVLTMSGVAIVFVLAAGAGVSAWQAVRATDAEGETAKQLGLATAAGELARTEAANALDRAKQEKKARETAEAVSTFMQEVFAQTSAHGQASPTRTVNQNLTVREAMDHAAQALAGRFEDQPEIEATLRSNIGKTYSELGLYAEARPQFEKARAIRELALGPDHRDTLESVSNLATLLHSKGDYLAAEPLFRRALGGYEKALGPDHPETLTSASNLAELLIQKGDSPSAEPLLRQVLARRETTLGPDHPKTLLSINSLAGLLRERQDYAAAEPLVRRALVGYEKAAGPDHPDTLMSVNNLASLLLARSDFRSAEPLYRRALAAKEKTLGPDHPSTLMGVNNLAFFLQAKGDYPAAEPLGQRALAGWEKSLGRDHPNTLASVTSLAMIYIALRRDADAIPLLERAVRGYAQRPERAGAVPEISGVLGLAVLATGRPTDAEPHLLTGYTALSKRKSLNPQNRKRLWQFTQGLVELYESTNQPAKAADWRVKLAALPPELAPRPRPAR